MRTQQLCRAGSILDSLDSCMTCITKVPSLIVLLSAQTSQHGETKRKPRSKSYSTAAPYSPPMPPPYGYSPFGSMYSTKSASSKRESKKSQPSFMKKLFRNDTNLPRTRSAGNLTTTLSTSHSTGSRDEIESALSMSALEESYDRGSTILALAVSTAATSMPPVCPTPVRKTLTSTLVEGAALALTQYGFGAGGQVANLAEVSDPVRRRKTQAKAAGGRHFATEWFVQEDMFDCIFDEAMQL